MMKLPRSHFAENTFRTLEAMLDGRALGDEAFRRLLLTKLSNARIIRAEEVDPQLAIINSRIDFFVVKSWVKNRILVRSNAIEAFWLNLLITPLRGSCASRSLRN